MYPVINLSGQTIQTYYVCAAFAAVIGMLLSYVMLRKLMPRGQSFLLPVIIVVAALIGARVLNYIINPDAYGADFTVWTFSYRKLSLMGGLILGVFVIVLYCMLTGRKTFAVLDAFVIPVAIGIILLKLGCFLNGCCFGIPTDGPFGMTFSANASMYEFINSLPVLKTKSPRVHPTQLYEMIGAFIAVSMAYGFTKKFKWKDGSVSALFAILFSAARWMILSFRELPYAKEIVTILYPCLYAGMIIIGIVQLLLSNKKECVSTDKIKKHLS